MAKIIFFGNGPLASTSRDILKSQHQILFHAHTKADLTTVKELKAQHPTTYGVLVSFGVIIRQDLLNLFEPTGILNIHPSLLPQYRGASPIETAILAGDTSFGVSIMKLVKAMDAGPVYWQSTLTPSNPFSPTLKTELYQSLATTGAKWLARNLTHLPPPTPQDSQKATFTTKLDKSFSLIDTQKASAKQILRQIIAFQHFPKPKCSFLGQECIILVAHIANVNEQSPLSIKCHDASIIVDQLQPANKKPMSAQAFLNGYRSRH